MKVNTSTNRMVLYDARNFIMVPGIITECSVEYTPHHSHHWANPPEWTSPTHCTVQFNCSGADAIHIHDIVKYYMDRSNIRCADFQLLDGKTWQPWNSFAHCYVTEFNLDSEPYIQGLVEYIITIRFSASPAC